MSLTTQPAPPAVEYPESDGKPMAESRRQYEAIVVIQKNLEQALAGRALVSADNFIYPVEGRATICLAPDVYVALGRPDQMIRSYKVWEQGGVFPQVIFEVLSPSNEPDEMIGKFRFYDRYGAEEYYIYDPERERVYGWQRQGGALEEILDMDGWSSPLLGIRFELSSGRLVLFRPDGSRFRTYAEIETALKAAEAAAEAERLRAEEERQRFEAEKHRADAEKRRADALAAKLRALGLDPDAP